MAISYMHIDDFVGMLDGMRSVLSRELSQRSCGTCDFLSASECDTRDVSYCCGAYNAYARAIALLDSRIGELVTARGGDFYD